MKKLQQNFTTPEQSKRLLELGMPVDSADCYHNRIAKKPFVLSMPYSYFNWDNKDNPPLPCWSVGRLIDIYVIIRGIDAAFLPIKRGEDIVKYLIRLYEEKVRDFDFSKLEE